jgi:1,2-diacylglycerol 3-beta-galactosyltransferase
MFKGYTAIVAKQFSSAFNEIGPDLIISVHPLMQHVPINVLRQLQSQFRTPKVPFATVVTDLTRCHATWFHRAVDRCFVATSIVASQALRLGLRSDQIVCHGLPIRPSFSAPQSLSKSTLRGKLGLDKAAPTVMIVGGGEGMGKLEETAIALNETLGSDHQVIIICGRNAKLSERLRMKSWSVKMHIKGFVNNMSEYMASSDCVISKAGPGTIAEAMICGVPIILNGCVPCQEEGNIPFVIENQVGAYSETPKIIAQIVSKWLDPENSSELKEMSQRAKALGRPNATFNIIRDLACTWVDLFEFLRSTNLLNE